MNVNVIMMAARLELYYSCCTYFNPCTVIKFSVLCFHI